MDYNEYIFTASEITELEALLDEIPEEYVIDRISLESRLRKARKRIAGIAPPPAPVYDDGGTEPAAALPVAVVNHNGDGERSEQQ